eukprot:m.267126 g.267126  ORF g.267126 m.267126 type:complete len:279 (-) comp26779_c0_seq1:450-1286(-)
MMRQLLLLLLCFVGLVVAQTGSSSTPNNDDDNFSDILIAALVLAGIAAILVIVSVFVVMKRRKEAQGKTPVLAFEEIPGPNQTVRNSPQQQTQAWRDPVAHDDDASKASNLSTAAAVPATRRSTQTSNAASTRTIELPALRAAPPAKRHTSSGPRSAARDTMPRSPPQQERPETPPMPLTRGFASIGTPLLPAELPPLDEPEDDYVVAELPPLDETEDDYVVAELPPLDEPEDDYVVASRQLFEAKEAMMRSTTRAFKALNDLHQDRNSPTTPSGVKT